MTTAELVEAPDNAAATDTIDERPEHVAFCGECPAGVKYKLTASGAGMIVLERYGVDIDTAFGQGDNTIPICPNGHGEMRLKDEELVPAADAIHQVAERLEPEQRSLPGIVPVFNYKGAYEDLEAKAVEVDVLHRQWESDAEVARDSKKAWEKAADTFNKMALEFRRRRREKAEGPADATSDPSAPPALCRFEQLSPGEPCPICTNDDVKAASTVAPESEAHGVEARDILRARERQVTLGQLAQIGIVLTDAELKAMSPEHLAEVEAWALEATQLPDERERWMEPPLPAGLGRPHVAGETVKEGQQTCSVCGGLFTADAPFDVGTLVGTDCPGPEHNRYPKTGKKKATRRKGSAE